MANVADRILISRHFQYEIGWNWGCNNGRHLLATDSIAKKKQEKWIIYSIFFQINFCWFMNCICRLLAKMLSIGCKQRTTPTTPVALNWRSIIPPSTSFHQIFPQFSRPFVPCSSPFHWLQEYEIRLKEQILKFLIRASGNTVKLNCWGRGRKKTSRRSNPPSE